MNLVHGMSGMMGGCGLLVDPCLTPVQPIINSTDPFGDGSLIAKYLLDGDATDLCGNYDGVDNTEDVMTYTDCKYGQGTDVTDPTTQYIRGVNFGKDLAQEPFSVSAWVMMVEAGADGSMVWPISTSLDSDEDDSRWDIRIDEANNRIRFQVAGGTTLTYDVTVECGVWYYVTFTSNESNRLIYLNGEPCASDTVYPANDGGSIYDSSYWLAGHPYAGGVNHDYGKSRVDQVEIYNRALNPQEVQMLYTQSKYSCNPTQAISGLVAHYPLDGTAEDLTGNYNGTENGGLAYIESEMGIAGSFDGTDDYVESGAGNTLLNDNHTISLWVKFSELDTAHALVSGMDSNEHYNIWKLSSNEIRFQIYDGSWTDIQSAKVGADVYYHITATLKDGTMYMSINGVDIGTTADSGNPDSSDSNLVFGAKFTKDDYFLNGSIKNVRIYNKALTANEIETIYNYERVTRNIVVDRGLVAYYPLKNSSEDHWVSQYDGTDNGDVSYDGQSASFDGDGDYIEISSSAKACFSTDSSSFSCWITPSVVDTRLTVATFMDGSGVSYFLEVNDGGFIRLASYDDGYTYFDSDTIQANTPLFLSVTKSGTAHTLTVNSTIYSGTSDTATEDTVKLLIGVTGDTSRYFNGSIANVRIYDRALSQEEITTIYNTEKGEFE